MVVGAALGLSLASSADSACGQSMDDLLVMKGQVFSQTSAATLAPYLGNGGVFEAQAPGLTNSIATTGTRSQGKCSGAYSLLGLTCGSWPNRPLENYQTVREGFPAALGNYWWTGFGNFHQSELIGFPSHPGRSHATPQAVYSIVDGWQMEGGGGNPELATLTVNNTTTLTSSVSATITENATITLKHTPQQAATN